MKTNKRVLSLLLALVMVFATAIPAFATGDGIGGDDTILGRKTIEVKLSKAAQKDYDVVVSNVAPTNDIKDGTDKIPQGSTGTVVTFKEALEAGKTYKVELVGLGKNDLADEKGALSFDVVVKADGKVEINSINEAGGKIATVEEITFDLKATPGTSTREIQVVGTNGELKTGYDVKVFGVKNSNGKYDLDKDGFYQLGTYLSKTYATSATGKANIDDPVEVSAPGLPLVALVVEGAGVDGEDVIKYVDLSKGSKVIVTVFEAEDALEVTVKNEEGSVVPGATVELQPQTGGVGQESAWGAATASVKTDGKGVAKFAAKDLSKAYSYVNAAGDEVTVERPVRVVATAPGYEGKFYLTKDIKVTTPLTYVTVNEDPNIFEVITSEDLGIFKKTLKKEITVTKDNELIRRISAGDRYETALKVAKEVKNELTATDTIVLASGANFADALVASSLATETSPLILTNGTTLTDSVKEYINLGKDNQIKALTIVGGKTSVSAALQQELQDKGIVIKRVAGSDRFETSVRVLEAYALGNARPGNAPKQPLDKVLIANGMDFSDALVASVPSALKGMPVLLTAPKYTPEVVNNALKEYEVQVATIVGGEKSVSAEVAASLRVASVERISGMNRQLTSMLIAKEYFADSNIAIIASGEVYADALSATGLGAKLNAPVILSGKDSVNEDVVKYLKKQGVAEIIIVGGKGTVSENVVKQLEENVFNVVRVDK